MAVVNQVLVRKVNDNCQLTVPDVLKRRLFDQAHAGQLAAHLGSDRILAQLRDSYYWPGMSKMCEHGAMLATCAHVAKVSLLVHTRKWLR